MLTRQFTLPADFQPLNIRQALKTWFIPRKWQHFLRIEKNILVNGTYHHFDTILQPNDQLTLHFSHVDSQQQVYQPSDGTHLTIFYEDQDFLVVAKPNNIKTHPNQPDETDTLLNQVAGYLAPKQQQPYILHRLDMYTSGLIMIAKNPLVVPILNAQLRDKLIKRNYLAMVAYNFALPSQGQITWPIGLDPKDPRKRMVSANGLPAITDFKILAQNRNYQLLHLSLQTGRTHQIRVHLAAEGVPILGDPLYNPHSKMPMMFLHAYQMKIPLPFSKNIITVTTPAPSSFENLLR
ncbi:RluA family pseudouridine synthase [Agrilactobacillus yilanensis]|uniref:RNA pseudouridylate synthase n=1 Tax=Agrilactobacillus yilanensis TaxID=2485997 RepID=A0ABW4JAI7_9LACO|nr:RluA family pseudouridine synthase [Agrilactobacillus yilanensis]